MHRRSQSPLSITQSKESTRYDQRNHQRTGHSPPERPHARQKEYALTLYSGREKKKSTAYILWIVFAVYYFYLGHPVKNIIFWLLWTCFIGEIWWIIDLFRISGMVDRKNEEILLQCIAEARQLYPGVTGTMKVQIIKPDQTQE